MEKTIELKFENNNYACKLGEIDDQNMRIDILEDGIKKKV